MRGFSRLLAFRRVAYAAQAMRHITLTDQNVKDFQELYRTEFGIELTEDEARREADDLLCMVMMALRLD